MTTRRRLWQESTDDDERGKIHKTHSLDAHGTANETYASIRQRFLVKPTLQSWRTYCCNALVIYQEFSLTVYVLALHHVVRIEEVAGNATLRLEARKRLDKSCLYMLIALTLIVLVTLPLKPEQPRPAKVRQRLLDASLLAILLRFMAPLLRSLTASYASDTVQTLANVLMLLHFVSCDYSYANGLTTTAPTSTFKLRASARPLFQGGTLCLNAAFLATLLLVSRLQSNVRAYVLISLSILLFALYPVTRHALAQSWPPRSSPVMWIVTVAIMAATWELLDAQLAFTFVVADMLLLVVLPTWRWYLQRFKTVLPGPWDIPRNIAAVEEDNGSTRASKKD